jgi:hypothetical protein
MNAESDDEASQFDDMLSQATASHLTSVNNFGPAKRGKKAPKEKKEKSLGLLCQ